jgi:hypothetical protein
MTNGMQQLHFTLILFYPDHFSTVFQGRLVLSSNVTKSLQPGARVTVLIQRALEPDFG